MRFIFDYLMLPKSQTDFEKRYLGRMNQTAFWFLVAHLPVFTLIAWANDTDPIMAMALTTLTLAGPLIAIRVFDNRRVVSTVFGITTMLMGGLLVHFGQGPVQIEMHFYFFVLLALLAVFANPMVVVAAAVTAALHHAGLWLLLPASVFNYDAPFWVVAIHAAFVVLESVAACFIARSFFDNVIGLEKIVAKRTEQLEGRNNDMRMLLDSVEQGFFTINEQGIMSEERSAAVAELLGTVKTESFVDLVAQHDSHAAGWIELGLTDVFHGFLPIEVMIDQLPKRCQTKERALAIAYSPVMSGEDVTSLAVVVSDITATVEREKLEVENREMLAMIDRIAKDKDGFLEFFQEAENVVHALRDESRDDASLLKRRVHTLKGNSATFGLTRVSDACHSIEDYIEENDAIPEGTLWTELFCSWASTRGNLRRLVNDTESRTISLDDQEYEGLIKAILENQTRDELAMRVAAWRLETTQVRLSRIGEKARELARRLGKGEINVSLRSSGLRLDPEAWAPFWSSFVHVVRNAVDHGLEGPEDRRVCGKSEAGNLEIRTTADGDHFTVTLTDDGAGIHWDKVKDKAASLGLPIETHEDLVEALYHDGMSTAATVTDTSGRGVGMGAMRSVCQELGGTVSVDSESSKGTSFQFRFPIHAMAAEAIASLKSSGVSDPERVLCNAREECSVNTKDSRDEETASGSKSESKC